MATYTLTTPLTSEDTKKLVAGDTVLLNGTIYTARDAAHSRLVDLIEKGEELPFDLEGSVIYFVGPTPPKPGDPIGCAGPTSSYRMDTYSPTMHVLNMTVSILVLQVVQVHYLVNRSVRQKLLHILN